MATELTQDLTETEFKAFQTRVKESLWAYEEIGPEMQQRVTHFLVTGEDAECLLQLPAIYQNGKGKKFFKIQHGNTICVNEANKKKLAKLFDKGKSPKGYYQRLGEFANQIPELNQQGHRVKGLPNWFCDALVFYRCIGYQTYYYNFSNFDICLVPFFADLDAEQIEVGIGLVAEALQYRYDAFNSFFLAAVDWGLILNQHPDVVRKPLQHKSADVREMYLHWLCQNDFDFSLIINDVTEMAVGSSKRVREVSQPILRDHSELAVKHLIQWAEQGKAAERANAIAALGHLKDERIVPFLKTRLDSEKAPRVKESIQEILATVESKESIASTGPSFELPEVVFPDGEIPLTSSFESDLKGQLEASFAKLEAQFEKESVAYQSPDRPAWMRKPVKPKRMTPDTLSKLIQFMEVRSDKPPKLTEFDHHALHLISNWSKWTDLSNLHLLHVVRFFIGIGWIAEHHWRGLRIQNSNWLLEHRTASERPYDLRELGLAIESVDSKLTCSALALTNLQASQYFQEFSDWESEAVWPLMADQIELLSDSIRGIAAEQNDYWYHQRRVNAIRIVGMLPEIPPEITLALWQIALGESKADRPLARAALSQAPDLVQRGINALSNGKQGIRIAAAELLADAGDADALPHLVKGLKKEKIEIVKGHLLQAIEKLGGDVEEFLGKRKQLNDAKKGLEKKLPKGMEWLPLDTLPKVHWGDDGKPVAKEIIQWWIVQSIKFKSPVCGPILRRSLEMCRPDDAARLAGFLLSAWVNHDSRRPTRDEVIDEATKTAKAGWAKAAKWMRDYYKSEENYREYLVSERTSTFLGSAIGQKGVLAIVAAAGDANCVKIIENYIRTFHGHRLAQSKSLVETLSWIDDSSAIQLLLSLANRFRTRGIRKRAEEIVQEIAERQGWTMDQLTDRTIPTGGIEYRYDDDGNRISDRAELVLDYGSRTFSIVLDDDLVPVITRNDGKQVKNLPAAAKDDDEELVKAAKKEFSATKKTIKQVVKLLAERFYEAVCTRRTWTAQEWKQFLFEHAIAGKLCCRVVWSAQRGEESPQLFRPLEDGTLTDVNDDPFEMPAEATITIAHASLISDEEEKAWVSHLEDYEVPQLFRQFGRPTFRLKSEDENETELVDRKGHMLTTFQLRSAAGKLGWERGDVEDGGSFGVYHKLFRSCSVSAVLEFTGSYVPEEDIPAAIRGLYFIPVKPNEDSASSWNPNKLKLKNVPSVLLSECYNDVVEIASKGSGFDKDWEKKGLW